MLIIIIKIVCVFGFNNESFFPVRVRNDAIVSKALHIQTDNEKVNQVVKSMNKIIHNIENQISNKYGGDEINILDIIRYVLNTEQLTNPRNSLKRDLIGEISNICIYQENIKEINKMKEFINIQQMRRGFMYEKNILRKHTICMSTSINMLTKGPRHEGLKQLFDCLLYYKNNIDLIKSIC